MFLPTGSAKDGTPSMSLIWRPCKPILFEIFRPRTGLANILGSACLIVDNLRRHSFGCGKPEFTSTILPIIPATS